MKKIRDALVFPFLFVTFFCLALGQLGRISFLGQQINGYIFEIPALITLILLFAASGLAPIREAWQGYKSVFVFFGIVFVSFLFSFSGFDRGANGVAALYTARLVFYFLFFFYLLYFLQKQKKGLKGLFIGITLFACITVIFSVIQYMWYPELRNLLYLGWDPHLYRMFGTFFDTSIAAAVYLLCFFFVFMYGKKYFPHIYLYYVFLSIFFVCILFTFSRTTYIIFFATLLGILIQSKRYVLTGLIVCSAVLFFILVPKPQGEGVNLLRTFSIESRFTDYQKAGAIWITKPFLGYGYNHLRPVKRQFGLIDEANYETTHAGASFHSSFLVILVTAGVLGLAAFLWMLFELAQKGKHTLFFVLLISLLSLADNILLQPLVLFLFLCIMAYDIALSRLSDR